MPILYSLFSIALVACNGSGTKTEGGKEPVEATTTEVTGETDFMKNYEEFVSQQVAKLEKSSTAVTATESVKAAEAFINKYGDPNAMDMTPDTQKKFGELRDKYNAALSKAL